MPDTDSPDSFASVLHAIKDRTGESYETLARRVGIASSTLHRYCAGRTLPVEFGVIERLGRACDADRDDLIALHRAWAATVAARAIPDPRPKQADAGPPQVRTEPAVRREPTAPEPPDRDPAVRPDLAVRPEPAPGTVIGRVWTAIRHAINRPSPYPLAAEPAIALRNWALLLLVAVMGVTIGAWHPGGAAGAHPLADPYAPQQVLRQPGCEGTLTVGRHDQCVVALQRLLQENGAKLGVDGNFNEATQRVVLAFQALVPDPEHGGPTPRVVVTGAVDDPTKNALYGHQVRMQTWDRGQVEDQIRQVFPEDPDTAIHLAMCESILDPMWVNNNPRRWGVFGLTGDMLKLTGAGEADALDPLRNIQSARALWLIDRSFDAWPPCLPLPYSRRPV
jgi:Helix-turn-helix domain